MSNFPDPDDIAFRLATFSPYKFLHSFGFALGDERQPDGSKIHFANIPKGFGPGSIDMAVFKGQHNALAICDEGANEIDKLRKTIAELEAELAAIKGRSDENG